MRYFILALALVFGLSSGGLCAQQIVEKERVVTGEKARKLHEGHNKEIYSYERKELKFMVKENWLPITSWRLVHDGVKVLAFFESDGITSTTNQLFCGTRAECEAEIARLGLTPLPEE